MSGTVQLCVSRFRPGHGAVFALLSGLVLVAAGALAPRAEAQATGDGDRIVGRWLTAASSAGRATVEVTRAADGTFEAVIVALEKPLYPPGDPMAGRERVDREHPDPARRSQPIIGLRFLEGFRSRDGVWSGGTVYDPDNGKTYRGTLELAADGSLEVRGYIGIPLLGRTTTWQRAPSPD